MSELLETDPAKGFVALPMSVFELDLSPGAFRTLAELCRMANLEGQCWPSLAQLGDRLGRSRAAVSGYISELRAAGLIATETQKMANGYNYRLRYRVVFWKSWRKQLSQKGERSVKPVERPLRTKNHNHINQSPAGVAFEDDLGKWKAHVGHAPYPAFDSWPSEALLLKTEAAISQKLPNISADIFEEFRHFLSKKGISDSNVPSETCAYLKQLRANGSTVHAFVDALEACWKPHWSKPPSLHQIKRVLRTLPASDDPQARQKLLKTYLKRWEIHASHLSLARPAAKVAA